MENKKNILKWLKRLLIGVALIYLEIEIGLYFTKLPFTQLQNHETGSAVFDSKKELIGLYTNIQGDQYIPYEGKISPLIKGGIQAVEDQRFLKHHGIDYFAILRASLQNIIAKKRVSGASTITMQLIRLKMNNKRTWFSKIKEAWLALKLERVYSKDEILQAYLNNAPFGANIYGIETASLYYFGKKANDLNGDEIALLLGLPQSPSRLRPDRFMVKANARKLFILKRMFEEKLLGKQEYFLYSHQITKLNIHSNSNNNQIVPQLMRQHHILGSVYTNIDSQLQEKIRSLSINYFSQLGLEYDCAITVIEVSTGNVKAISELNHSEDNSYVSSAFSERSTGSCLKPFIYAKAFDLGLAWPDRIVSDLPISINGYSPRNNDYQNIEKIAIKDALKLSRNIPAVELLNKIGLSKFNELMMDLKLESYYDRNQAGLTSALGGLSISLLDMTNAYGVLAREGEFIPYAIISNSMFEKPKRVFTASSTTMLKECLIYNKDFNFYAKTGTSWGPRDAWCIGYDKNYSIGVWVGLKNGGSMSGVTGEATAYPLLGKIFSILSKCVEVGSKEETSEVIICNESGYRASRYCVDVRKRDISGGFFPPLCQLHQSQIAEGSVEKKFNILAPAMNASYLLGAGGDNLIVECRTSDVTEPTFWFVNGVFKGMALKQFLNALELKSGENIISSVNCSGQSDLVKIIVKLLP